MNSKRKFSSKEPREVGNRLGAGLGNFDLEEFLLKLEKEPEHGSQVPDTNVTNNDARLMGKIARANLKEFPGNYTRLDKLETNAGKPWTKRRRS